MALPSNLSMFFNKVDESHSKERVHIPNSYSHKLLMNVNDPSIKINDSLTGNKSYKGYLSHTYDKDYTKLKQFQHLFSHYFNSLNCNKHPYHILFKKHMTITTLDYLLSLEKIYIDSYLVYVFKTSDYELFENLLQNLLPQISK